MASAVACLSWRCKSAVSVVDRCVQRRNDALLPVGDHLSVAFSGKGRDGCPACNSRRKVAAAYRAGPGSAATVADAEQGAYDRQANRRRTGTSISASLGKGCARTI